MIGPPDEEDPREAITDSEPNLTIANLRLTELLILLKIMENNPSFFQDILRYLKKTQVQIINLNLHEQKMAQIIVLNI